MNYDLQDLTHHAVIEATDIETVEEMMNLTFWTVPIFGGTLSVVVQEQLREV